MIGAAGEQSEIDGWCEAPDDGMRTIWERGHDVDTLRSNLSIEFDAVGLAVAEFANGGADSAGGSPGNLVLGDEQGGSISFETMAFVAPLDVAHTAQVSAWLSGLNVEELVEAARAKDDLDGFSTADPEFIEAITNDFEALRDFYAAATATGRAVAWTIIA